MSILSCTDATRLIARRADGDALEASSAAALDEHLTGCPSCREALGAQRAVSDVLRARPAERMSPQFHARLARRLDDQTGWFGIADWRTWTFRLAPAAIALLLAAVLTSAPAVSAPLSLEEWAVGNAGSSSEATLLWDEDVTSDSVLQEMLAVETPAAGGGTDVR